MKGRSRYHHRPVWPRGPEEGPEMNWGECNDPDGLTLDDEDTEITNRETDIEEEYEETEEEEE